MIRLRLAVLLLLTLSYTAFSLDENSSTRLTVGKVEHYKALTNGAEYQSGNALVRITALTPSIVRLRYTAGKQFPQDFSYAVVPSANALTSPVQQSEDAQSFAFDTGGMVVRIQRATGQVQFLDHAGKLISGDDATRPIVWHGSEFRVYKSMPVDEHYFGLGDKAGPIDHRNSAFTMWNTDAFGWTEGTDPLYKSIPFFLGLRGGKAYGIFLDNTFRSSFDFGKASPDYYSFGATGGELNYYFIYGPDPKSVIENYTTLTGRTPLPPLFSLAYQQSRYSYFPEARVRQVAEEFRRRHIPLDVIYFDIDYLQGYRAFDINRTYFPHFEQLIKDLAAEGIKSVVISDLHLEAKPGYAPYDEGLKGDDFLKNPDGSLYLGHVWPGMCVFPDFTRQSVRDWYGSLYKDFVDMGVRGFWNDMNEPAVFRYPQKTIPLDVVDRIDDPGYHRVTNQREIHNVFGMQNVRATHDGLLKLAPNLRPFVLTRAAFAGTQRYAATWTGDNSSTWTHYRLTLPTILSMNVSGYPLVGDDIGGFAGSPTPDLLTRWMELGAFIPIYRNHTSNGTLDQEPWVHGPYQEAIRKRYIETRYRLLPYIYTSMEKTSRTGVPLMRPMFVEFPSDDRLATIDSEYMFGPDLLVAPKLLETLDPYDVIFPKGPWYDYWTGERIEGGVTRKLNPPLDVLPVYVRGGSILPQQPVVQSTDDVPNGPLELRVYPGPDCHGSIYSDDGKTFDYRKGAFFRQSFTCEVSSTGIQVKLDVPAGNYHPWWHQLRLTIFGETRPREVFIDGRPAQGWKYDEAARVVTINMPATAQASAVSIAR